MRRLRVETDKRLIHNNKPRLVYKRGYDGELLLHSVRVCGYRLSEIALKLKVGGVLMYTRLAVLRGNSENIRDKRELFLAGHKLVDIGIIGDIGYLLFDSDRRILDILTVNKNLSAVI